MPFIRDLKNRALRNFAESNKLDYRDYEDKIVFYDSHGNSISFEGTDPTIDRHEQVIVKINDQPLNDLSNWLHRDTPYLKTCAARDHVLKSKNGGYTDCAPIARLIIEDFLAGKIPIHQKTANPIDEDDNPIDTNIKKDYVPTSQEIENLLERYCVDNNMSYDEEVDEEDFFIFVENTFLEKDITLHPHWQNIVKQNSRKEKMK